MAWNDAVVTDAGVALLQQVLGGKELILDSASGGSGTVDATSLITQTALSNQKQTFTIHNVIDVTGGKRISVLITNQDLETGYTMNQLGILAHIGTADPVLFAILQDGTGINIPSKSEMSDFSANFYVIIAFSGTGTFAVASNPAALLSHADIDAAGGVASYESLQAHIADTVVHMTQAQKDQLAAAVPNSRKVNGKALSTDITLSSADVGAVPTSRTVNGKALSANITLGNTDVGAAPLPRSFAQHQVIAKNSDVNALKSPGRYAIYGNDIAVTLANLPQAEAGYIDVYAPPDGAFGVVQRYMPYSIPVIYYRWFGYDGVNKVWSPWRSVSNILASGSMPGDNNGMFYYEKYTDGRMHEWGYWSMLFNVTVAYGNMYQYSDLTCGLVDEWPSFAGTTHMTLSIDSTGRLVPVGGRVEGRTIHFNVLSPVVVNNLLTTIRFDIWGRWK